MTGQPSFLPDRVQQVVVTRFAKRMRDRPLPTRDWIDGRMALFERFTLPSMRAQTVVDFTWWLICDVTVDADIVDYLHALDPRIRVALTGPEAEFDAIRATGDLVARRFVIAPTVDPATTLLVQTRLDSDDALHPSYLRDIEGEAPLMRASGSVDWLRVASAGFQYDAVSRDLYRMAFPRGPFQSYYQLLQPGGRPRTMPGNHGRATLTTTGYASSARESWVQVVHGGNILNRIGSRNRVKNVDAVAREFGLDL